MKRIINLFLAIILTFSCLLIVGCQKANPLEANVVELRSNVYQAQSETYRLKASYGFKTDEKNNKIYTLTVYLYDRLTDNATYSLSFIYGGTNYQQTFTLNPLKNVLTLEFQIENFNEKSFEATLISSSFAEKIVFNSTVPSGTIDYKKALEHFQADQKTLIENRTENSEFTAKIVMRIVVKEDKAYWYVGIIEKDGSLKALLLDGLSGKTLAIREVF